MIIEEWKYSREIVHDYDFDQFYCDKLNRMVDLGWDRYVSTVHQWVISLNNVSRKLHENKLTPDLIKMNRKTFILLEIESNEWYNFNEENKLGTYFFEISEDVKDKEVHLNLKGTTIGKVIIK